MKIFLLNVILGIIKQAGDMFERRNDFLSIAEWPLIPHLHETSKSFDRCFHKCTLKVYCSVSECPL
jgi:hypothetical protein